MKSLKSFKHHAALIDYNYGRLTSKLNVNEIIDKGFSAFFKVELPLCCIFCMMAKFESERKIEVETAEEYALSCEASTFLKVLSKATRESPEGYLTKFQSWALSVFFNLFNNRKLVFALFVKLI